MVIEDFTQATTETVVKLLIDCNDHCDVCHEPIGRHMRAAAKEKKRLKYEKALEEIRKPHTSWLTRRRNNSDSD